MSWSVFIASLLMPAVVIALGYVAVRYQERETARVKRRLAEDERASRTMAG